MLTAAPVPVAETRTRRPRLSAAERTNGLACPRSGVRTGTREGPFAGAHGGVGEPRSRLTLFAARQPRKAALQLVLFA